MRFKNYSPESLLQCHAFLQQIFLAPKTWNKYSILHQKLGIMCLKRTSVIGRSLSVCVSCKPLLQSCGQWFHFVAELSKWEHVYWQKL